VAAASWQDAIWHRLGQDMPESSGCNHNDQPQQGSSDRIVRKRLPDGDPSPIDCDTYQPDANPLEICDLCVLELSVAVWTEDEEIAWVMADFRVEMMYFKVRFAASFFEGERAKLALSFVQFSEENANSGWHALMSLCRNWRYPRARLPGALLSNSQQLFLGYFAPPPSGQPRKRAQSLFCF
jgi:hypothetical protein